MDRNKGVTSFLLKHMAEKPVSFHMPGHKGGRIFRENGYGDFLQNVVECDITEIPGADNLFQTEGIIRETMDRYKALYGTKETYLLINGSSAGLIGAIMTAVPKGGKLIMARNCHKSIYNGLYMTEGKPVYAYPEIIEEYGITGAVSPAEIERCLKENPDAQAVILPSPNYYGICSDIKAISEIVHKAGKLLIVDQAHGAHLKFFDKYINDKEERLSAEEQGADFVINSVHKTLASFTQSAVLNVCTEGVNLNLLEDKLQLIESTSPSYILMSSMDMNSVIMEEKGETLIGKWQDNIDYFYEEAQKIPGLKIMRDPLLDRTKINLDMSRYGIDGIELENLLIKEGIYPELATGNITMCMTGIGNSHEDYCRLIVALEKIATEHKLVEEDEKDSIAVAVAQSRPDFVGIPDEKEWIHVSDSAGRISGASIIPYPPGIPIVCPGEIIDGETAMYVKELRERGVNVMGVTDRGMVCVGKVR